MSVQEQIHQILWNKRYVSIPEDIGPQDLQYIIINDMTIEDRNVYAFVRRKELEIARKQGVPTEIELFAEARQIGLWTSDDDLVMAKADEHITFLQSEQDRQKFSARKKSLQAQIDATLVKKNITQEKKNNNFINSADYYAHEVAASTLIRRIVYNIDGNLLWPTDISFLDFKRNYPAFIIFVTNEVLSEGLMLIDEIREIARCPEWRLTWTLQRENLPAIFDRCIGDLTLNQKLLIYWSRVYDSAFESSEPPSVEVINDDDKFDDWLASRDLASKDAKKVDKNNHQESLQSIDQEYIEVCTCGAKAKNVGKYLGERLPHASTCMFGILRVRTQQEKEQLARQVYARNSDRVRNILDQEQQMIVKKGLIEEQNLRNMKTRTVLGMKTDIVSKK